MTESSITHQQLNPLNKQNGLTLLELTIVLLIMMALAGLVLPTFNEVPAYAQCTATKSTMKAIRDALLGNVAGVGYVDDIGDFPDSLTKLLLQNYCDADPSITGEPVTTSMETACTTASGTMQKQDKFNPVTDAGWRKPYMQEVATINTALDLDASFLSTTYVAPVIVDKTVVVYDSFSHNQGVRTPVIIQNPGIDSPTDGNDCVSTDIAGISDPNDCIRLVSAGANGVIDTPLADAKATVLNRGDDVILYLKISDPTAIAPEDDQTGCSLTD